MALYLSSKHRTQLLEWAKDAGKQECCGLFFGHGSAIAAVELARNVAGDRARHFEIDPAVLIAAHKRARDGGFCILGHFHSHPNGLARPSAEDVAQAADEDHYWLIIANGAVSAWRPCRDGRRVTGFEAVALVVEG